MFAQETVRTRRIIFVAVNNMHRSLTRFKVYWLGSESHNALQRIVPIFRTGGSVLESTPMTMQVMCENEERSAGKVRRLDAINGKEKIVLKW